MNPEWLFPWLAAGFGIAGLWRWWRSGSLKGAASTWLLLAVIFGAVAGWLLWYA